MVCDEKIRLSLETLEHHIYLGKWKEIVETKNIVTIVNVGAHPAVIEREKGEK